MGSNMVYTVCFIRRGDDILMLNREKKPNQGLWNGVGGKIEEGETPRENVIREVYEETGLKLSDAAFRGVVTWKSDGALYGPMYIYLADCPADQTVTTPKKIREGILDWKPMSWIMAPENLGVTADISRYFKFLFEENTTYEHLFIYEDGKLRDYVRKTIPLADFEKWRSSEG